MWHLVLAVLVVLGFDLIFSVITMAIDAWKRKVR